MTDATTATFVDKSTWPRGPWDDEPDRLEWRTPAAPGFACLIVRGRVGALCGYVGVPPGHPAHGQDRDGAVLHDVFVHGGLTFAGPCQTEGHADERICHVPEPGESDDVWWLGFDCAHAGDISPGLGIGRAGIFPGDVYRDVAYVRAEVVGLALQLATMGVP